EGMVSSTRDQDDRRRVWGIHGTYPSSGNKRARTRERRPSGPCPGSMTHERLPLPHVSRRRNETCFDAPTRGTRHATHLCWFLDAPDSRSLAHQRGWPPIVEHSDDVIGLGSADATNLPASNARGPTNL